VEASPLPPPPAPERKAKRKQQLRRRHVVVTGVRACGGHCILLIVSVGRAIDEGQRRLGLSLLWCRTRGVPKPPPRITLSTEEGEIRIERVEGSGVRAEDRRVVVQVIR
jgi:hypothetical protein